MTYIIPNADSDIFDDIIFKLYQNPEAYKGMLSEIKWADPVLHKYINRTCTSDEDALAIREKNVCAIMYHVLKRGLHNDEELPALEDNIAWGLEITKAEDPETLDEYIEEIKEYDPGMYKIILHLSAYGETPAEKQQLYRSAGFVYIALMESLDEIILNEDVETTPCKDYRLDPFRKCIDGLDFRGL